jgi:hypothetical protein
VEITPQFEFGGIELCTMILDILEISRRIYINIFASFVYKQCFRDSRKYKVVAFILFHALGYADSLFPSAQLSD